jgi:hypothetical protein
VDGESSDGIVLLPVSVVEFGVSRATILSLQPWANVG